MTRLRNYRLRPPQIVIAADDRDPRVSWQHHLDRTWGLRGGVDLVALTPQPVYARTAGRMVPVPNDGSAGNSSRFYHRDNPGWKDVFSHLSSYRTPKNPQGLSGFEYEAGDIVAYTGATPAGVAPHLHWHLLDPDDVRRNPWDYFTLDSGTAGEDLSPVAEPEEEEDMTQNSGFYWKDGTKKIALVLNTDSGFVTEWSGTPQDYDNAVAGAFKTGSFAAITQGHRNALVRSAAEIQARSADDDVATILARINDSILELGDRDLDGVDQLAPTAG